MCMLKLDRSRNCCVQEHLRFKSAAVNQNHSRSEIIKAYTIYPIDSNQGETFEVTVLLISQHPSLILFCMLL